jgi:outer membrane protein assembly factor BamA
VLDVQAIALYIQRARVTWTKPWLLGQDGLDLRIDGFWEQAPFVYRPFDYDQWWATADLQYTLVGPLFVQAGGGYESFHQRDLYDWDELGAGVGTFAAGRRDTWLLRGGLGIDTRDNPFYPTRGLVGRYGVAYRTGGDIDGQTTHEVDLRAFVPLPGPPILALHGYGKAVDSVPFTEYVIRWGGPETVRGARYAGREGDTAYIATAELRWPLFMMPVAVTGEQVGLGLHAFTDVGDAFYDDLSDPNPRALFSFGAGAHINLLTWQLRFEAAKERDRDWVFEFMDVFNF